jgi:phosphoenolpyruvate carboxykinase (GTP)
VKGGKGLKREMGEEHLEYLKGVLEGEQYRKLAELGQGEIDRFVAETVKQCKPATIFIATDSDEDREYVRTQALARGEELELATPGHTYHFDGILDQGRDKENTRYLLPPNVHLG